MALLASVRITPHFTAGELNADDPTVGVLTLVNIRRTCEWLEAARAIVRVPLRITSGYRTPQHNADVGGVPSSAHVTGEAADFVPVGLTLREAYDLLAAERGRLPAFDQLIFYPATRHIHVGLGGNHRRETRIHLYEGSGGTPILTAELVQKLGGTFAATIDSLASGDTDRFRLILALSGIVLLLLLLR